MNAIDLFWNTTSLYSFKGRYQTQNNYIVTDTDYMNGFFCLWQKINDKPMFDYNRTYHIKTINHTINMNHCIVYHLLSIKIPDEIAFR